MGTTVVYKGNTIADMDSGVTKVLKTGGTWTEGDITINNVTFIHYYSGTSVPSSSVGANDDLYFRYTGSGS